MWYTTKKKTTSKDYVESVLGIMGMLGPLSCRHKVTHRKHVRNLIYH